MRAAEREAQDERDRRLAAERQAQPAQPAQQVYSEAQLQSLVDAGRITPAQMASQLAIQATAQLEQRLDRKYAEQARHRDAAQEVDQYIDRKPSLMDSTSEDFRRVAKAAYEIAAELSLDVKDSRVQRRALRETFGTLDRLTKTETLRTHDRTHADLHVETGRGNGGGEVAGKSDPLKHVPKAYLDQWEKWGYSRDRMIAEAKYVTREPRRVTR